MTEKSKRVKVPAHLKAATKKWFKAVLITYVLEPHHIRLLTLACEAWDRSMEARAVLQADGLTYNDRFGAPHPRPEVKIKEQAETIFSRLLRELALDVELPKDRGRPPGIY